MSARKSSSPAPPRPGKTTATGTAARWAFPACATYRVAIAAGWTVDDAAPDLLIALHARRSAAAVAAFRARHPDRPCVWC
jgi:hypothetical protein